MTERHRAAGLWEIAFRDLPQEYVDQLDELGHIAITVAHEDGPLGDHLLDSARYVGVVRFRRKAGDGEYDFLLRGAGLAWWLGTEDKTGDIIETPTAFAAAELDDVVRALLPDSLAEGTLISTGLPTFTHTFTYISRREALDYACDTVGAEWRVRGAGRVDAGPKQDLYGDPKAVIVRRIADAGDDMDLRAFPGPAKADRDIEDYTTRVVVLGRVEESTVVSGAAELPVEQIPYRDLLGNPVKFTRLVNESSTEGQNATARAQAQLAEQSQPATAVTLDTGNYDMRGAIEVGADVWVYDPDAGLEDPTNEITFRGQRLNPRREQVRAMSWPITAQMGVYYRSRTGEWLDVSRWVDPVDGQTTVEVGKQPGDLSYTAGSSSPTGRIPEPDTSVPAAPVFQSTFPVSTTQSNAGSTRVQLTARWFAVTANTDTSAFVDGSNYELRYRRVGAARYTWAQLAAYSWDELGTWDNPVPPDTTGAWSVLYVPIDETSMVVPDLEPATRYQFQVRAIDSASPPNVSSWSAQKVVITPTDELAPTTPAAAEVAGNPVSIQVRHYLGTDQGGTFNLESDLRLLQVHASTAGPGFTHDATTKLGDLTATYAMLLARVPAIGTFSVATTEQLWVKVVAVDEFGNESDPSVAVAVTAELISDQYVTNVSATKVIAGEFAATYGVTGLMISGDEAGSRFESGTRGALTGMRLYRPSNTLALSGDAATGDLTAYRPNGSTATFRLQASTGNVYLYKSDGTTPALTLTAATGMLDLDGRVTAGAGVGVGATVVVDPTSPPSMSLYPNATTARTRILARTTGRPDSSTAAGFEIETLNTAGQTDGFTVSAWSTNVWIGHKATSGAWTGGRLVLERSGGLAGLFSGGSTNGKIQVTDSGQVFLGNDNGNLAVQSDGSITSTPIGGGNGLNFAAQNGQSSGYRMVAAAGVLRFVENASNQYLQDGVGGLKSFVIPHPREADRWLVHVATESPEALVEYHGHAVLHDGAAEVALPSYFEALTLPDRRQVQVSMVLPDEPFVEILDAPLPPGDRPGAQRPPQLIPEHQQVRPAAASTPRDGRFRVACSAPDGTRVAWHVIAARRNAPFDVEPRRDDVVVHGNGPYRFLTPTSQESPR